MTSQRRKLSKLPLEAQSAILDLEDRLERLEAQGRITAIQKSAYVAQEGDWVRCAPAPGSTLTVLLPRSREQNRRARIRIIVETTGGSTVVSVAGDGTINGLETITLTQRGLVEIVSAGTFGWVTENAPGTAGSDSTDLATYYVESSNPNLPNARVGTASTEITPSHAVANVVTWALNTASVVLAKLQDLAGLSILGRAANSTGVMGAITATAARQTPRVDDAGTSLEWGDPLEVRDGGTDEGDVYAIDVEDGDGITGHVSIASRVATISHYLNFARVKTVSVTGVVDTSDWDQYDVIWFNTGAPIVQNIPQPLDPDGNPMGRQIILMCGFLTQLTLEVNTGTSTGRIFTPTFEDAEFFRGESVTLTYSTQVLNWFPLFKYGVVGRQTTGGSQLVGKEIVWDVGSAGGISVSVTKAAGQLRIVHALDDIPLTLLDDQADDTWNGNISGGDAPPTANSLSSLGGNFLSYNASTHAFDVDLSSVTYTADSPLQLSGQAFGMAPIAAGSWIGTTVDGGTATPGARTGLEMGEAVKHGTIEVLTASTTHDSYTLDSTTNSLAIQNATVIFQGITSNPGRILFLRHTGSGSTTVEHLTGTTSADRVECPGGTDIVLTNMDQLVLVHHNGRWRPYGCVYTAGDGLDLSGTQFSADVSDFAGTALEDDGSNNLRVAFDSVATLTPSGSGTIAIDSTYSHIRIDPSGSFTCTGITGGYAGQVVFVNMTTGGGDEVIWQDGSTTQTPYNQDIVQNQGEAVLLWRASNGESKWYVCPLYPVTRALTGAIERDEFSTATRFAGVRTNGSLQTARTFLNLINTSTIQIIPNDDSGNDEWELYPSVISGSIDTTHLANDSVTNAKLDDAASSGQIKQYDGADWQDIDIETAVDEASVAILLEGTRYITEQFFGGVDNSTEFGNWNWTGSVSTVAEIASEANHPGITRIGLTDTPDTGCIAATTTNTSGSALAQINIDDVAALYFVVRIPTGTTLADIRCGIGLVADVADADFNTATEALGGDGIVFRHIQASSGQWDVLTQASSTSDHTPNSTGHSVNDWMECIAVQTSSGVWSVTINGSVVDSGLTGPTDVDLIPVAYMDVDSSAFFDLDEFTIVFKPSGNRYT